MSAVFFKVINALKYSSNWIRGGFLCEKKFFLENYF